MTSLFDTVVVVDYYCSVEGLEDSAEAVAAASDAWVYLLVSLVEEASQVTLVFVLDWFVELVPVELVVVSSIAREAKCCIEFVLFAFLVIVV